MRCHRLFTLPSCLILALIGLPTTGHADPQRTPGVRCSTGGLSSAPSFTQVSPGRAEYQFSGVCVTREGQSLGYRIAGTWTPGEADGNANASEVYRVDRLSGPSESFTALVGWRCDADPWLFDAQCARVGDNIPSEPYAFWEEFGRDAQPSSRQGLSSAQRLSLRAEYERANGGRRTDLVSDRMAADAGVGSYAAPVRDTTPDPARRNTVDASLNPQPLPPEPDPDPNPMTGTAASAAKDTGEVRAIIIVGGKTRAPSAKTTGYGKSGGD